MDIILYYLPLINQSLLDGNPPISNTYPIELPSYHLWVGGINNNPDPNVLLALSGMVGPTSHALHMLNYPIHTYP